MDEKISKEEASRQVVLMAKRCAILYETFAETIMAELGEEKGAEVVARAIKAYGTKSGSMVRKGVEEKGQDLSLPNYFSIPDLPALGWVSERKSLQENELEADVLHCPMAEYWISEGKAKLGRQYCYVDQAKFSAYNPDYECIHVRNVLDGDSKCTMKVRRKK